MNNLEDNKIEEYIHEIQNRDFAHMEELVEIIEKESLEKKQKILTILEDLICKEQIYINVFLYSAMILISKTPQYVETLIRYVLECDELTPNSKFFCYYQITRVMFLYKETKTQETISLNCKLFKHIVQLFQKETHINLEYIPLESRNHNRVVVITEQFLEIQHGPTKTALDRCQTIITNLKKQVLLINTAEFMSLVGCIPFVRTFSGNYDIKKLQLDHICWKNINVPYFQCENNMPDYEVIDIILQTIRDMKPEFVIMIGGSSIVGNLVDNMIPVLTVGTVPSSLSQTMASYQTFSGKMTNENRQILKSIGMCEENVIESVFTSGLKEQTEHVTRAQIGISEDKFVMAIVGARLDIEVTDEFLEMLEQQILETQEVVFIGYFSEFDKKMKKYIKLRKYSKNLGFCNDILSRLECCDLYINPIRTGGGTSCVEALSKGIPVVCTEYGDVAVNAGEHFIVKDYKEMQRMIHRYMQDKEFYNQQSEYALKRAKKLLDTDGEFVRILEEVLKREKKKEMQYQKKIYNEGI